MVEAEAEDEPESLAQVLMTAYPDHAYEVVNRMRAIALDYLDMAGFRFWGQVLAVLVANNFQLETFAWWRADL